MAETSKAYIAELLDVDEAQIVGWSFHEDPQGDYIGCLVDYGIGGTKKYVFPATVEIPEDEPDLNDLTVAELEKLAAENDIEVPSRILKADLVALLEEKLN